MSHQTPLEFSSIEAQVLLSWNILPENQSKLSEYFIRHWDPKFFCAPNRAYLPITHNDITYLRIYHPKPFNQAFLTYPYLLFSFRRIAGYKYGYVLITPPSTSQERSV